jgi:hypothetical protein
MIDGRSSLSHVAVEVETDSRLRCLQHARMEVQISALSISSISNAHISRQVHYEINGAFLEEGQLLKPENIEKIRHIPCTSSSSAIALRD